MTTILEFLAILETEFEELSWTICPNLEMGILSANTFEISKKPEKLQTLLQKLESQNLTNSTQNSTQNLETGSKLTEFNSKNPMEIATFLSTQIENYLETLGIKTQIKSTDAYINLDLDNILWQEFLAN